MNERPLSELRPGDVATIGRLDGCGPVRRRLLELGLTPGTAVTLVRLAPLRDPMEIRVRGYQLCVRRSEADAVWVRAEPTPLSENVVPIPALAGVGAEGGAVSMTGGSLSAALSFLRLFRSR